MAETVRDAKLRLKIDTADGLLGIEEMLRATAKLGDQERDIRTEVEKTNDALAKRAASAGAAVDAVDKTLSGSSAAAARTIDRYGPDELSKSEIKRQRAEERAREREMLRETKAEIAAQREARAFSRKAKEDAQSRRAAADEKAKRDAVAYSEFKDDFESEQFRLEQNAAQDARKSSEKAWAEYLKRQKEAASVWERYWKDRQAEADRRDEIRGENFRERVRGSLQHRGLIDARSDYQRRRDSERGGLPPLAGIQMGMRSMAAGNLIGGSVGMAAGSLGMATASGPMAAASLGVAAFVRSLEKSTEIINAFQNSDLTGAQKLNVTLDTVTGGVSKTFREFINALDGTTERMRLANRRLQDDPKRLSLEMRNREYEENARDKGANARLRGNILAITNLAPMETGFNRDTMRGQLEHDEHQRRLAAGDELQAARMEARIARGELETARARSEDVSDPDFRIAQANRLRSERADNRLVWGENNNLSRNQARRHEGLADVSANVNREQALFEESIRNRERLGEAGVRAAQAEARAREAHINVMRTELEIVRNRARLLTADASRLGNMSVMERQLGLQSARQVRDHGVQNVTPEVRQRASSFAPEWYQMQARQFGEGTSEFSAGRAEGFLTPGSESVASLRQSEELLMQTVREQTHSSNQRLSAQFAEIATSLEGMVESLLERIQQLERQLRVGYQLQANAQH